MAGRKGRSGGGGRKPIAFHLADGTMRKCRHGSKDAARKERDKLIKSAAKAPIPEPPEWLGDAARDEWAKLAPVLIKAGYLDPAMDLPALATYCRAYDDLQQASREIKAGGITVEGVHGGRVRNPAVVVANQAANQIRAFLLEFGLSPASRARMPQKIADEQPLDGFRNERESSNTG